MMMDHVWGEKITAAGGSVSGATDNKLDDAGILGNVSGNTAKDRLALWAAKRSKKRDRYLNCFCWSSAE